MELAARMTQSHKPAALCTFVALAFGWTWGLLWIGATFTLHPPWLGTALLIIIGFGPSFAALCVVWMFEGSAGLRQWLRRCLSWRLPAYWYALAFLGPPVAILVALGSHAVLGGSVSPSAAKGQLGLALLQSGLTMFVGGPLGEEFGWRGYALPELTARLGWRWASLIVGAVWGLWHLPLFFIPGMAQAQMPMALFMASSVALSVLMARMSVNTAFSVLPAMVFHWSINTWSAFLPIIPNGGSVRPYVLVMNLLFVVAIIVFLKPGPDTPNRSFRQ
jgi:uncharacterized protein